MRGMGALVKVRKESADSRGKSMSAIGQHPTYSGAMAILLQAAAREHKAGRLGALADRLTEDAILEQSPMLTPSEARLVSTCLEIVDYLCELNPELLGG